jgi:hypothetical protein
MVDGEIPLTQPSSPLFCTGLDAAISTGISIATKNSLSAPTHATLWHVDISAQPDHRGDMYGVGNAPYLNGLLAGRLYPAFHNQRNSSPLGYYCQWLVACVQQQDTSRHRADL